MKLTVDLEDFLGEEVVDRDGEPVGTFACYWHLFDGRVAVLGVFVGTDSERTRVAPARGMRVGERHSCIRLPFSRPKVENAPVLECDQDLEHDTEEEMYRHYDLEPPESYGTLQIKRMTTS
jgi:hypothetical protein